MSILPGTLAKRLVVGCALLAAVALTATGGQVLAASKSKVKLSVKPVLCEVDVVQDGSGQTLQVPKESCIVVVPEILTPVLGQKPDELPFAGDDTAAPIARLDLGGEAWLPIASADDGSRQQSAQSFSAIAATLGGIGAIAAITTFGVDAALFEMGHSKSIANWVRARFGTRFLKLIGRA